MSAVSGSGAEEAVAPQSQAGFQQLYLLGHPVAHSKSPAMYNAAYERLGLPWHYGLADRATAEEAEALLRSRGFLAVNITTPYKPLALAAADALEPAAALAQGANLLIDHGGALRAYNVDGAGCVAYLRREQVPLAGARAVVCGTGPTALAILHELAEAGVGSLALLGRDGARTAAVLAAYSRRVDELAADGASLKAPLGAVALEALPYQEAAATIVAADLIVDATPLGMAAGDPAPFDTGLLSGRQVVLDVVYGHGTTALMAAARQAGCQAFDGRGMLVGQGVASLQAVCRAAGMEAGIALDELFALMAHAAGFDDLA